MISSCNEFLDVQLRISEKRILNTLNKDPNRITIRYRDYLYFTELERVYNK
jgi:ATP-dependent DNA helicase HFM1/MER3